MRIDKSFFASIKNRNLKASFLTALAALFVVTTVVIATPGGNKAEVSAVTVENNDGKGGFESPNAPVVIGDDNPSSMAYKVYRVKKGDMIGPLAESFGVTQDTLLSVNHITNSRALQINQYLKIPLIPGIIHTARNSGETPETIAEKYDVDLAKIIDVNGLEAGVSLKAGATIFVPDAKLDAATLQAINGDIFHWPLQRRTRISSWYSWRRSPFTGSRQFHNGIDLPAPSGTPIYPGAQGTVIDVGYNNVYGNYVIVAHHSGYSTLYGHMSAVLVSKGNFVSTGTRLGLVGNTGQSTGPHVHFTVYKNGRAVNPVYLLP
jgi:murein DD-endopeptidase MepM/ murein hydrolase activator NlpD